MATHQIKKPKSMKTFAYRLYDERNLGSVLSPRTQVDYAHRIKLLSSQIAKSQSGQKPSPKAVAAYMTEKIATKQFTQSTARTIKAAVSYWLVEQAQIALAKGLAIGEYESAFATLQALSTNELPKTANKTSSTKLRYFPVQALKSLIDATDDKAQTGRTGAMTAFVEANMLVGLRPSEWFEARFSNYLHRTKTGEFSRNEDGALKATLSMVVPNDTTENGRLNGGTREILLHNISDGALATLLQFQNIVRSHAEQRTSESDFDQSFFKPIQRSLRNELLKAGYGASELPTVYSTRHQAVANAKYSGLNEQEIAALFGYGSVETVKKIYGKESYGWTKMDFTASPESIAAVKKRTTLFNHVSPSQRIVDTAKEWNKGNSLHVPVKSATGSNR